MTNKEMKWIKSIALVMAVVLLVSVGFIANGKALKAEENTEAYTPVEATPSETVQEIVIEAEAEPAEEPAEEAEEPAEEAEDAEEPAEEADGEEAFDVVKAYAYYMSLDEAGKAEYLASLSAENRAVLVEYIAMKEAEGEEAEEEAEEAEEVAKSIRIICDHSGRVAYGTKITLSAYIEGYGEGYSCQWQVSKDGGKTWEDIAGATGANYSFTATAESLAQRYRIHVEG